MAWATVSCRVAAFPERLMYLESSPSPSTSSISTSLIRVSFFVGGDRPHLERSRHSTLIERRDSLGVRCATSSGTTTTSSSATRGIAANLFVRAPERMSAPPLRSTRSQGRSDGSSKTMRVIISGAPASGKGTQCELLVQNFGLVHVSAGDLLRAEVAAETENGKKAKSFMDEGHLVPDEVVNAMMVAKIKQIEAEGKSWLVDGYPRSASQAAAMAEAGIEADMFILLEVPDEILVDRVVGRRLDPVTGKIYHLTFFPPENEEIAARLNQRSDDTEEKVKARLRTHYSNVESVLSFFPNIIKPVNGNRPKDEVFSTINELLATLQEEGEIDHQPARVSAAL